MKLGFVCFLVLGLASTSLGTEVALDNVGSETKEITSKILGGANKRGAVKITNTDAPNFNQLSSTSTSSGYKTATNPPPFKYLYSSQYHQPNPYLTYVQIPQAAHIAAQYAYQPNPAVHYLQTPTQIQYVSAPTVAQVPYKYQSFGNEYSTSQTASTEAAASSQQYVTPSQQIASPSYVSSGSGVQTSTSPNKQVQTPVYSGYQAPQQFYYPQQPFYTFLQPQVSPISYLYQQPNDYLRQQQQQLLSLYGGNRFVYTPTNAQVPYIVPVAAAPTLQESTTASNAKPSDKTLSTSQHTTSSSSYTYGTKA